MSGVKLEKALDDLEEALGNTEYSISERCSTHIHLDVSDMTPKQVVNLYLLSAMFEHVLFRLFGNTRTANTFCLPVDSGTTNFDCIVEVALNPEFHNLINRDWSKYSGINLGRCSDLGTIEYRMFTPIVTKSAYIRVLEFLFRLKSEAMSMTDFKDIITYKKANSLSDLFTHLFPNEAFHEDYEDLLERGVKTVNDILLALDLQSHIESLTSTLIVERDTIHDRLNEIEGSLRSAERGI